MLRFSVPAAMLLASVVARPAASILTDDEPSNDAIGTAAVQIFPTAAVTTGVGEFTLVSDDIDYLGISGLVVGDIVTVSTTPLGILGIFDEFGIPDTGIGVFTSGGSMGCRSDDTRNNEIPPPPFPNSAGLGSLCRFVIPSAGTWFVGATGSNGDPAELFNGNHSQNGVFELHVTINAIDRPFPTPTPAATPAEPAGAVLIDDEPCNDEIAASSGCPSGAPIQMVKTGPATIDGGEFVLVAGDIDFVGIAALSADDIITVSTTPLSDVDLEVPNTIVGVFDSSTTDPTFEILCRLDDIENNELITQGQNSIGLGSLCRFRITAPGDYYVGVTGFRPKSPGGCDPALGQCTAFPFDGGITPGSPCEEQGPTFTCGNYQMTIAVNSLPEPGVMLQLVSGGIGLAWLNRRRNRSMTPSSQRSG
jgi:hypothetical protein